jgi:hypothetical protein
VITAVFPATAATIISATAIAGVTPPVTGATPVTTVTAGTGYTGTVTWNGDPVTFAPATVYTATISLTATEGYTLTGVTENQFTIAGTTGSATNSADSGVITAVFPATDYLPYWADGASVGNLTSTADWQEISGITQSTLVANSSYLWMQSDGSVDKLFAVSTVNASNQGEWTLTGINGVDYEDLSSARVNSQSYIYLADFGDNANARSTIIIYRIKEPAVTGSNDTVPVEDIETITMEYPAGSLPPHKDAETLLVDPDTGDMYVITKREAVPGVYYLAHAASYAGTQTMTDLGDMYDIPDFASVSATGNAVGGNISPSGKEILVKSYNVMYLFSRDKNTQTIMQALQATPTTVDGYVGGGSTTFRRSHPSQEPQGEAVTFDYNGENYYTASEYVSTEGSTATRYPLFKYNRLSGTPTTVTFQDGVYPTAGYAGTLDTYIWDTNPAVDYGTATSFVVDPAVGVETDQRKGLLKFDISSIPAGSTIVGVELDLYISTEGQGWKIHRMLVDWNESSTYNSLTAGVDNDDVEAATAEDNRNGITLDTIVATVRNNMSLATVQGWVSGTYTNYGWLLEATDLATGDGEQFASGEAATATQHPKLIIRYIAP